MIPRLAQLEDKLEKKDKIINKLKEKNAVLKVRVARIAHVGLISDLWLKGRTD